MPLPELPLNIHDPSHDVQRDGVRDGTPVYNTQQGGKRKGDAPQADLPQGHTRYDD